MNLCVCLRNNELKSCQRMAENANCVIVLLLLFSSSFDRDRSLVDEKCLIDQIIELTGSTFFAKKIFLSLSKQVKISNFF